MTQIVSSVIVSFGVYIFKDELKDIISKTISSITNQLISSIKIKRFGNEKIVYCILLELEKKYGDSIRKLKVKQCNDIISYTFCNGFYRIYYEGNFIFIKITDKTVTLWCCISRPKYLKKYLDSIYIPDKTNNVLIFYSSQNDNWSTPIFRRPRNKIKTTIDMQKMLDDINHFYGNEREYENNGYAFRRGYFIEGAPGSGKSNIIEKIANLHNMCVYMIQINSGSMCDDMLIDLVSKVPPKSLVVFDEFDKQYNAIQHNPTVHISDSGILNAIDGPQRLSHGSIVVMIVNDKSLLPQTLLTPLLRVGRLDQTFIFH